MGSKRSRRRVGPDSRAEQPPTAPQRTFALVGHRGAGKTSLGELLLHLAGATRTIGSVDARTALLDATDEERRRGASLSTSCAWIPWEGHRLDLVDTPGSEAAAHDRALAVALTDGALLAIDAANGFVPGAEAALDDVLANRSPLVLVPTKLERLVEAGRLEELEALYADVEASARARVIPLYLPFVEDGALRGLVSVLDEQVLRFDPDGGGAFSPEPVPLSVEASLAAARDRLCDAVALTDDELLHEYLEFLGIERDRLASALAEAVRSGRIVPAVPVSTALRIGGQQLLDAVVRWLPSPDQRRPPVATDADGAPVPVEPHGAFVGQVLSVRLDDEGQPYTVLRVWSGTSPGGAWRDARTGRRHRVQKLYFLRGPRRAAARSFGPGALLATWDLDDLRPGDTLSADRELTLRTPELPEPMMHVLVRTGQGARARDRLEALATDLARRDLLLRAERCPVTGAVRLSGASQAQIDLAVERLRRRFGGDLTVELPPVAYRETLASTVRSVRGVHRREDAHGLVDEFGACVLDVSPLAPEEGLRFHDLLPPDDVDDLPARYRPAVDEGVRLAATRGPTAGYPVVGLEVRLTGGEYDILQSTEEHFQRAGEIALKAALRTAGTRLLEPWSHVEIRAPYDAVNDVLSDLAAHRGRLVGVDTLVGRPRRTTVRIEALCPDRELRTFASRLLARTHGRGRYVSRHSHYEPLPSQLEREVIATSPHRRAPAEALAPGTG